MKAIYRRGDGKSNGGFWKFDEESERLLKSVEKVTVEQIVFRGGKLSSCGVDAVIAGVEGRRSWM